MGKKTKRFMKLIALLLSVLMLSGCWNSRELDELAIVMGVALDKSSQEGMIDITDQVALISGGGSSEGSGSASQSSGSESYWNITGTGTNVFTVLRDLTHETSRKLYGPHTQVVIIGNDLAKDGIRDYLDLFLRDHEMRLTIYILVAKGRASDIFNVKPKFSEITSLSISQLIQNQGASSETPQVRMMDFLERLLSGTTAPIAPIIEAADDGGNKVIKIAGTAVFKQDKLVGELDNTETRGLLWVLGEVKSGVITVDAPGGSAEIEISSAQSDVNVEINDDGSITAHVKITESGNIAGQKGSGDLSKPENVEILVKNVQDAIANEVMLSVQKSKELDADTFGFGQMIYKKYPSQWESMKDNWDELFKNINVEVEVEASIKGSGRITKPAYPSEED